MHAHTQTHTYTYVHALACAHAHTQAYMDTGKNTDIYTLSYRHMDTHTYIHKHKCKALKRKCNTQLFTNNSNIISSSEI